MAYFFVYPFGTAGDRTTVPDTAAASGPVSYQYGFGAYYQQTLGVDPTALPIPRDQTNQLFYDVTEAIQQYQTHGVPDWISAADNLGVDYPYEIYARVRYDAGGGVQIYENQVAANTATPGADNTWSVISGSQDNFISGMVIDWAGTAPPTGFLMCDGAEISRTTYASLFSAITFTQNGTTNGVDGVITGLTDTSLMYVGEVVEGTGIPGGSVILTIDSGTQITLDQNTTGAATVPITFLPFGQGNGSTTFNVPDLIDRVTVGADGTLLAVANKSGVGLTGGLKEYTLVANDLPAHTHAAPTVSWNTGQNFANVPAGQHPIHNDIDSTVTFNPGVTATGTNTTTGQAVSRVQPTMLMNKIIKT